MDEVKKIEGLYKSQDMGRDDFESFLKNGHEISELIEANLRKAFSLIKNFKTMAVDQASEERRPFKIKEYTEEILSNLNPKLKKTRHTIQVICDDESALFFYPGYYSQIITNLVLNSVKHGFEDNCKGRIQIKLTKSETHVSLHYSDNGIGIPPEVQNRIFEPFYTTKRHEGGSGLGLHIVYSIIVNKLKGTIQCESRPGYGTEFFIKIPKDTKLKVN